MSPKTWWIVQIASVASMGLGLFARDTLTEEIANICLFGGVIVGCLNVFLAPFIKSDD